VLGISQSGASWDIVRVLEEGRQQGALTLAITNAPNSPLAHAANHVIDIQAGEEKAVAATKSYTAQLMAVAMLSAALSQDAERFKALQAIPDAVVQVLSLDSFIEQSVGRYRYMEQCVVLGRGFNYATAYEWSLKLKELTYVVAEPYSSADFQHGPIAIVERGFPVLAVLPSGRVFDDMMELVCRLAEKSEAELVIISDQGEALTLAQTPLKLPEGVSEWMSPLVSIVPGQLFAYYLGHTKGYDAEHPRGLRKVTLTW
jgi:glucosamine--fructose-6-phosphate aminotransferase (isomerizing)